MTKQVAMIAAVAAMATAPAAVIGRVRAEAQPKATDPAQILADLNKAFEEFKSTSEEQLKAKADDVVTRDKLDKLDKDMTALQSAVDKANEQLANAAIGGGNGEQLRDPEYSGEFQAYFRNGVTSKRLDEVRAAATKTDAEGGFLAPVEWDRSVTGKLKQVSPMRQHASVIAISGAGFKKVFSDRVVGSGWVGETAARPATTAPGLAILDFVPGEIYANPAASQGLIDDAEVDIEQWLADEVSAEFAKQEGIAFLSGNGTNKPYGILTYVDGAANDAVHPWGAIEAVASGAVGDVDPDALFDLIGALPEEYEGNAKFFMNRGAATTFRKMKDANNNYLWQPSLALGQPATLAGEAVVNMPGMPTIAAGNAAVLFGDMAETYQIVDKVQGMRVLRDPYTNKPFVHFYTTKRVGGGVKNPEAMKALVIDAA